MDLARLLHSGRERFPNAVAIHHGGRHLTYARAFADVEAVAASLVRHGVRPGEIVAADIHQPMSHWVVLLALLRVGAVSVSLTDSFEGEAAALPGLSAVVCGASETRTYGAARRIHLQADWLRAPPGAEATLPAVAEAERSLGRICFTSGTSGRPKAIELSSDLLGARLAGTARRTCLDTRSVLWCGLGPDTAYGFTATLAAWLEGAAVVFSGTGKGAHRHLAGRHVNLVVASPAALAALIKDVAPGAPRLEGRVIVAGGRLAVPLRDQIVARLCEDVFVAYGSSEAGGVAFGSARKLDLHPGRVGRLYPDVEAAVVGEDGAPLPAGAEGRLRVRTGASATGYLNDPVATAAHFEGGWFQSGDAAVLAADGSLTIVGRPASILNLGGVKLSADELDAVARDGAGIDDACAVVLDGDADGQRLAILIAGGVGDPGEVAARLRSHFPALPRFLLVSVAAIPRGSMGKVNRAELATVVGRAQGEGDGGIRVLGTY
jgi:acyl-coenzyme A synthetase/AMP-(fatty) acid ligase